jgi:uncharacterized protein YcgI (DUF1989 family)
MTGIIPARKAVAVKISKNKSIKVSNTHGTQIIDTFAFADTDASEYMSMEHTRGSISKINPKVGDTLLSNLQNPTMTITEDTSPRVHDTLIAACDAARYRQLGVVG